MSKGYLLCTALLLLLSTVPVLLGFDLLPDHGYTLIWPLSLWAMILHRVGSWLVLMIDAGALSAVAMTMRGRSAGKNIIISYWCIIWGTSLLSLLGVFYVLANFDKFSNFSISPEIRPSQISAIPLYVALALHTGYVLATSLLIRGSIRLQKGKTD